MPVDKNIRKPAVAGAFYPASPTELRSGVEKYLAEARDAADASAPASSVIIAPHAGYVFSASVAASAYIRIPADTIKTVIIIGPSHQRWFDGIRVSGASHYETPLGLVEVDLDIVNKLCEDKLCRKARDEEAVEHCLEVHLPFLQVLLHDFKIVPVLTGNTDPRAVSKMLLPLINDTVLTIASSDLSHFLPQDHARATDDATLTTVLAGDIDGFMEGCGDTAMRVVMDIAAQKGLIPELLDARTSFDAAPQRGDADRVVGYASVAFVKPDMPEDNDNGGGDDFSSAEKLYMLQLARQTITDILNDKKAPPVKQGIPALPKLSRNYGCFVTLHSHGQLRGCVGYIEPIMPLCKAIVDNAASAAFRDSRFPQVRAEELDDIEIEISVLTKPQPLEFETPDDLLNKLIPREHGVILKMGGRQSTFLPQVWEQLPDKTAFLEHLSMKAGMDADDWKRADVMVYRAVHFSE